jgi:hypothetical protein
VSQEKFIQTYKLNVIDYLKFINEMFKLLKIEKMTIHHLFSLFIRTIACSHKQQYVYDESKDESVFY